MAVALAKPGRRVGRTQALLVIVHEVLCVGDHAVALHAPHKRFHESIAEIGVFPGQILKVASAVGEPGDVEPRSKVDVRALAPKFGADRVTHVPHHGAIPGVRSRQPRGPLRRRAGVVHGRPKALRPVVHFERRNTEPWDALGPPDVTCRPRLRLVSLEHGKLFGERHASGERARAFQSLGRGRQGAAGGRRRAQEEEEEIKEHHHIAGLGLRVLE